MAGHFPQFHDRLEQADTGGNGSDTENDDGEDCYNDCHR